MAVLSKKEQERADKRIIDNLERLGGKSHTTEDDYLFEGDRYVFPAKSSWAEINSLSAKEMAKENEETNWTFDFAYRPWDGAYCMANVLRRTFGVVSHKGPMGFFGRSAPQMITVNSDVDETVEVPWGSFELPSYVPGVDFNLGMKQDPERGALFQLYVSGKKKMAPRVRGIVKLVTEELQTASLYRGKAFDGAENPEFINVWAVDASKVVYSGEVESQMQASVWNYIEHPNLCLEAGLKPKRSVLLFGSFGTGKTLGAMITGQKAVSHGVTFIKGRPGKDDISYLLQTALLYQPAVVFCEDVDALITDDADRPTINKLLDDFDGLQTKGTRVLIVMTTNYPDRIQAGLVRPGRIDRTIEIEDLDREGVRKLIGTIIPEEQIDPETDWEAVFEAAQGYKPAFVTEFAGRTVEYRIANHGSAYKEQLVGTQEFVAAAHSLRAQYEMMLGAKGMPKRDELGEVVKKTIDQALIERLDPDYLINHGS